MIVLILIFLGLCFGSFVNALVWRLHETDTTKKLSKKRQRELSILHGRSMCTYCQHELAWYDLLPVISWSFLGGKCRYCKKPISWQYPLVELITAILFVMSYVFWPYGFSVFGLATFSIWLMTVVCFMALSMYDIRWMLLPVRLLHVLYGLTFVIATLRFINAPNHWQAIMDTALAVSVIAGMFYILHKYSRGKWLGDGDISLAISIGLLVGSATSSVMVVFFASVMGSLVALPFLIKRNLKLGSQIPFGQFLMLAAFIVFLFGERIFGWYINRLI